MSETDRFFAIIPIHGKNAVVEGQDISELQQGIDYALRETEASFPNHDFRAEIKVIQGREVELSPKAKPIVESAT